MDSTSFHVQLHEGLKLIGFEKYYKAIKQYSDLEFNQFTFQKGNQKAFEVVTYFLFNQLKNSDYTRSFRGCYPCLDKTHESDFRKNVIASFKKLERDPLFNHKFLPGIVCNPGGDSFVSLYLAFLNYVLKKLLNLDRLHEASIDELQTLIGDEETLLMENCRRLKEKTVKEEEYCAYFDEKLNAIKLDEKRSKDRLREVDDELANRFGTIDTDELMNRTKANFDQIRSHKLKSLFEQNEAVLSTGVADIENRTVNLADFVCDSLLPVDLITIERSFQDKLDDLKRTMNKENTNIDEAIEKLDLKTVCYSSTNRILKDLIDDLERKINTLKQQTDEKRRAFLERGDVQELISYVRSKINFNPPAFEFKPEKTERSKPSLSDLNLTTMDQTLANRSTDDDFNLSINLAEMTNDYASNENDESYMQQTLRNYHSTYFSHIPNLDNINE